MLIPAWLIAVMASLYALEYFRRFLLKPRESYLALGKAIGRVILAGVYWYVGIFPVYLDRIQILVRWALFIFLAIDLIYILQEHLILHRRHEKS